MKKVVGIILAAGKGTRLNDGLPSDIPKVLHLLGDKPLIFYCIKALREAGIEDIIVVVGYKGYLVKEAAGGDVKYVVQEKQLGTADAVYAARDLVSDKADRVVVLNGDNPLFSKETIADLIRQCVDRNATISLVTIDADDPKGYGRIIKDKEGHVLKIVEDKEAEPKEKAIKEINAGCYCFENDWLWKNIKKVKLNSQGEYYLTDLIGIAVGEGEKVVALKILNYREAIGINTPEQLEEARRALPYLKL